MLAAAGVLAIAAAAWVTSERRGRGALASVGIVIGPLPTAGASFLAAQVLATFGDWPRALIAAGALGLCLLAMGLMWRSSRRPWDDALPATRP